jgi:hypothetical protein
MRALTALIGVVLIWMASIGRMTTLVFGGAFLIGLALAMARPIDSYSRPLKLMVMVIGVALLALTTGIDTTRGQMRSEPSSLATIKYADGISKRVVLRSGDRGLLTFDPREQRFLLEKWDDIKSIDWPRSPLLPISIKALR